MCGTRSSEVAFGCPPCVHLFPSIHRCASIHGWAYPSKTGLSCSRHQLSSNFLSLLILLCMPRHWHCQSALTWVSGRTLSVVSLVKTQIYQSSAQVSLCGFTTFFSLMMQCLAHHFLFSLVPCRSLLSPFYLRCGCERPLNPVSSVRRWQVVDQSDKQTKQEMECVAFSAL